MPDVNITDTEINPVDVVGYGGGRKELSDTEINPAFSYYVDLMLITETEINPTYITGAGGGRRTVSETEINPAYTPYPTPTETMGKTKGFDFRGKGLRI